MTELLEVDGTPVFTPQWDYWRCIKCMGYWVVVKIDAGTTPTQLPCKVSSQCGGQMHSAGYRDPALWPSIVPRVADAEWYRPSKFEQKTKGMKTPKLLKYIREGGLVARVASETTPMFPGER